MARRQSSPYTGKLSARPAGKPGDFFLVQENLRRSLPRHSFHIRLQPNSERPVCVFQAWRNLSVRWGSKSQNPNPGRDRAASRWSAPGPGKERAGRITLLLIVRR